MDTQSEFFFQNYMLILVFEVLTQKKTFQITIFVEFQFIVLWWLSM